MQTLLDAGANPYVKSNLNWTALSYAIKQGYAEVVKTFIDYGIDIKRWHVSMTPLGFAKENQEISHMLLMQEQQSNRSCNESHVSNILTKL